MVTKPERHYDLLSSAHYSIMGVALVVVIVSSWTMQTKTSGGQPFDVSPRLRARPYFPRISRRVFRAQLDGEVMLEGQFGQANNYTLVVTGATWAFLLYFSAACSILVGLCTHGANARRLLQATFFEGVLVFVMYNGLIVKVIGEQIMGWREPGKLADCGDDCSANYGKGWADGARL